MAFGMVELAKDDQIPGSNKDDIGIEMVTLF